MMEMTFESAWEYLKASWIGGRKKGLEKMAEALRILGNPQDTLKIIHVAGTNGKGSFCAMMGSVLTEAGYTVGCFTSPHLETVHERFAINGQMISDEDFGRCMGKIAETNRAMFGDDDGFSFFEILTLLAFVYFRDKAVNVLLLEVGIGGRLDATNVIESPLLTVVMSVGMDHMEILGETIEEIAREDAGIVKENCPLVLYHNPDVVYNEITNIAATKNVKIYHASDMTIRLHKLTSRGTVFTAQHEYFGKIRIQLSLIGYYQLQNVAAVLAAAVALIDAGFDVAPEAVQRGLAKAKWPGRMEIVGQNPLIVLEGAHNLQGAQAARKNIDLLFADREITLVMGILDDKEYHEIARTLSETVTKIIFTKPAYDSRAVPPLQLAKVLEKNGKDLFVEGNVSQALAKAMEITDAEGVIFCSGSLYLIGDIKTHIKELGRVSHD